jgi:hypothetical protein
MSLNTLFSWVMKKRLKSIDFYRKNPFLVQSRIFNLLIQNGAQTVFGKQFQFNKIKTSLDFSKYVPLQDYETLRPWVEQGMKGGTNVLWPSDILSYAKSSGTTGSKSKLIPITKESLKACHQKAGKDILAIHYAGNPKSQLYKHKHLVVGGSFDTDFGEFMVGDLSAIIIDSLPVWAEIKRTPDRQIALLPEWEEKLERIASQVIKEDVCILVGVPSWTYVLCQKILELSGKHSLNEVWPNLELFMHGGVNFSPYQHQFESIIRPGTVRYLETYNASEGFFGMQDDNQKKDLLLMLDYGIFYEFIPMKKYAGVNSDEVLSLDKVKLNEEYAIVISTNGGLWRYIVGDTIRFTNLDPFRFLITGRTKSFINAFGEEVIVENAEYAIAEACASTGAIIQDYTACPKYLEEGKQGCHEWLIEFTKEPLDMNLFIQQLDSALMEVNSDYEAKRHKGLMLQVPLVIKVGKGVFNTWLKKQNKLGPQNKIPRLMNNRTVAEQILQLNQVIA